MINRCIWHPHRFSLPALIWSFMCTVNDVCVVSMNVTYDAIKQEKPYISWFNNLKISKCWLAVKQIECIVLIKFGLLMSLTSLPLLSSTTYLSFLPTWQYEFSVHDESQSYYIQQNFCCSSLVWVKCSRYINIYIGSFHEIHF